MKHSIKDLGLIGSSTNYEQWNNLGGMNKVDCGPMVQIGPTIHTESYVTNNGDTMQYGLAVGIIVCPLNEWSRSMSLSARDFQTIFGYNAYPCVLASYNSSIIATFAFPQDMKQIYLSRIASHWSSFQSTCKQPKQMTIRVKEKKKKRKLNDFTA